MAATLTIDVVIDSDLWKKHPDAEDDDPPGDYRGGARLARDARRYRGRAHRRCGHPARSINDGAASDKPTNVLSFPGAGDARRGEPRASRRYRDRIRDDGGRSRARQKASSRIISRISPCMAICICSVMTMNRIARPTRWNGLETDILARIGVPDPYAGERRGHDSAPPEAATLKSHA